ncbi:unnamed protein product [Arctia plantaginis]|uniref:Uncharacterized protein n=1 Tax=Arctia plantaginis TaxID=874455 RepID=A0A8S0Z2F7_ARCPL|nr:unnamed protein product [Arctia plantaginis]
MNKEPVKQSLLTVASGEIREDVPYTPANVKKDEFPPLSLDIIVSLPSSNTQHRISALSSLLDLTTPQNPITMENFLKISDQNNEIKINHSIDNELNLKVAVKVVNHGRVESVLANKQNTVPTKKAIAKEADKQRRASNRSKNNKSLTKSRGDLSHTMSTYTSISSTATASTSTAGANAKKNVKTTLTFESKISKTARSCRNKKENKDVVETEKVIKKKKECKKCNISPTANRKGLVVKSRHQESLRNCSEWSTSEDTLIYRALASADTTYSLFKKLFPNRFWRRAKAAAACKSNKSNNDRLRRTIKKKRPHINQTHNKNKTHMIPNTVQSSHIKCDKSVDTTDLNSRPETNGPNSKHLSTMSPNDFTDVNIMNLTVFGYFNPLCERQRMAQAYVGAHVH